jgi:hypothetical protein
MSDEKKELSIGGEKILYTDSEADAADFLDDLDRDCFEVILYYAKDKSYGAPFLDDSGHKYILKRNGDHFELSRK